MIPRLLLNFLMLSFISLSILNKITGNTLHEVIGLAIVVCIVTHTLFNLNWYNSVSKRKSTFQRRFNTTVIFLLLGSFCALFISSILISKSLFSFLEFKSTLMLRQIHTTSAYWFFILCFIHLGIYWQRFSTFFKTLKMRVRLSYSVKALLSIGVVLYAGCVFVQRDIGSKLFMTFAFEFWDYEQAVWKVFLDYISMMIALIVLTHSVLTFKSHLKKLCSIRQFFWIIYLPLHTDLIL